MASAVAQTESEMISIDSLSRYTREKIALGAVQNDFTPKKLKDVIQDQVRETIGYCEGDRVKAAELLGISMDQLDQHLSADKARE